jgi:hypothetical protein
MGTPLYNFVELKHKKEDTRGLICLPSTDMIFISKKEAAGLTPELFEASLLASKCLHKLKCIAISVTHPRFRAFISDSRNYTALELVFVVVNEAEDDSECRQWGLDNHSGDLVDSRLSSKKEILFEVLHPSNPYAGRHTIPGIKIKGGRSATHRDPEALEELVLEMSRRQKEGRFAPNVRFVRLAKCLKTRD